MKFRLATAEDTESCLKLNKSLQLSSDRSEKDGFVIESSGDEMKKLIEKAVVCVALCESEVVGYISGYPRESILHQALIETPGELTWDGVNPLQLEQLAYLHGIAVHTEHRKGGTAEKLFNSFRLHFPDFSIWTAIVEAPYRNHRSARIIRRFGFRRVGQFSSEECFGLKNYQSGLYFRDTRPKGG